MLQIVKQKPGSYPFLNLTGKYGPESGEWKQKNHNIKIIDQILFETISTTYIRYKDNFYFDDIQEMLKREYLIKQYGKKMQNLAQYYKFHRCLPFWNDNQVDNIMSNYYSRLKDVDYKRIKSLLKRQQNISLTTQKSFSSFSNSEQATKKSHYSSILNDLQHSNDTFVLRDICNKISEATEQVQSQLNFKGKYCTGEEKFEQFLSKESKKHTINENKNIQKPKVIKLHTKKESNKKNKISTETMTTLGRNSSGSNRLLLANRQLRQKFTIEENKALSKCKDVKSASSLSISKKNIKELSFKNVSKDKLASTKLLYEDKARGSSTSRSVLSSRKALKKINNEKLKQSIQSKIDIENPIVNFRTRSNSTHSEKSKTFGSKTKQKTSQKQKNALQSTLKGSIPISVARGSIIELTNIKRQIKNFKSESERSVQRKSSEKMQLGGNNRKKVKQFEWGQKVLESSKHERTMSSYQLKENLKVSKNEKIYGKKRNSVVQNMLQKKLVLFKKKHAL